MTRWQDIVWPPEDNVVHLFDRPTARERLAREIVESYRIAQSDAERRRERRRQYRQRNLYPWLVVALLVLVFLWLVFVPVPL